jgi:hypothetical protein
VIDRLGDFADLTPDMVVADVGTGRIADHVRTGPARLREAR